MEFYCFCSRMCSTFYQLTRFNIFLLCMCRTSYFQDLYTLAPHLCNSNVQHVANLNLNISLRGET